MKRFSRWVAGIAGVLLLVGLIAAGVGYAMGGRAELEAAADEGIEELGGIWVGGGGVQIGGKNGLQVDANGVSLGGEGGINVDHKGVHIGGNTIHSGSRSEKVSEENDLEAFQELEVEVSLSDITIETGDGYGVRLTCDLPYNEMDYTLKDGVLKIYSVDQHGVQSLNAVGGEVVITLPEGAALEKIDIHTDLGDVDWKAKASAREVELSTDLGNVTCKDILAESMEAESDLGEVIITIPEEAKGLSYSLSTDLGEVRFNGKKQENPLIREDRNADYFLEAKSNLGNVELNYLG